MPLQKARAEAAKKKREDEERKRREAERQRQQKREQRAEQQTRIAAKPTQRNKPLSSKPLSSASQTLSPRSGDSKEVAPSAQNRKHGGTGGTLTQRSTQTSTTSANPRSRTTQTRAQENPRKVTDTTRKTTQMPASSSGVSRDDGKKATSSRSKAAAQSPLAKDFFTKTATTSAAGLPTTRNRVADTLGSSLKGTPRRMGVTELPKAQPSKVDARPTAQQRQEAKQDNRALQKYWSKTDPTYNNPYSANKKPGSAWNRSELVRVNKLVDEQEANLRKAYGKKLMQDVNSKSKLEQWADVAARLPKAAMDEVANNGIHTNMEADAYAREIVGKAQRNFGDKNSRAITKRLDQIEQEKQEIKQQRPGWFSSWWNAKTQGNDVALGQRNLANLKLSELDREAAVLRPVRDYREAEEHTAKLPRDVLDLLDKYNSFGEAVNVEAVNGGEPGFGAGTRAQLEQQKIAEQIAAKGYPDVYKLAQYRKIITDRQMTEEATKKVKEYAEKHPVAGAAAARVLNPVAAVAGTQGVIRAGINGLAGRRNAYTQGSGSDFLLSNLKSALDEGAREKIAGNENNKFLKPETRSFFYDLASSTVDSLAASAIPGGEAILGASAMVDTTLDTLKSGGTTNQAVLNGVLAGTFETAFEHISIGQLKSMSAKEVKSLRKMFFTAAGNLAKAGAANASEEGLTELADMAADYFINGGISQYWNNVFYAMEEEKMSYSDAKKYAAKEAGKQAGLAALSGLLMGVPFAAVGTGKSAGNMLARQELAGEAVMDEGRAGDVTQAAQANGARARTVQKAQAANEAQAARDRVRDVIEKKLKESGRDEKTMERDAGIVEKEVTGKKLTPSEQKWMKKNGALPGVVEAVKAELGDGGVGRDMKNRDYRRLGRLEEGVKAQLRVETKKAFTDAAESRLRQLGEESDARTLRSTAQAIAWRLTGDETSGLVERMYNKLIGESANAKQVLAEYEGRGAAMAQNAEDAQRKAYQIARDAIKERGATDALREAVRESLEAQGFEGKALDDAEELVTKALTEKKSKAVDKAMQKDDRLMQAWEDVLSFEVAHNEDARNMLLLRNDTFDTAWADNLDAALETTYNEALDRAAYMDAQRGNRQTSITGDAGTDTFANLMEHKLFERVPTADRAAFDRSFQSFYELGKATNADGSAAYTFQQVAKTTAAEPQFDDEMKRAAFEAGRRMMPEATVREQTTERSEERSAEGANRSTTPTESGRQVAAPTQAAQNVEKTQTDIRMDDFEEIGGDDDFETEAVAANEDGRQVAAPTRNTDAVTRAAAAYQDAETATAFVQGFDNTVALKSYERAFSTFYAAGINANGKSFAQVRDGQAKGMLRFIGEETAQKAFDAGQKAVQKQKAAGARATETRKNGRPKASGTYYNRSALSEIDSLYRALAARTGLDIERNESVWTTVRDGKTKTETEVNGQFLANAFKVVMSANANSEFSNLIHELGHVVAAYYRKGYRGLLATVRDWYMETEGIASYEDAINGILRQYDGTGTDFSRADAEEEFFSEAFAGLFSTDEGAQQFLDWLNDEGKVSEQEKKSIIQKFAEVLQQMFDHLKALIRGGTLSKTAEDFAQMQADRAQALRQEFLAALDTASENAQGETVEGAAKNSIKKSAEGFVFVDVDPDVINLNDGRSVASVIAGFIKNKYNNVISVNGQQIRINADTNNEWRRSEEATTLMKEAPDIYNDKMKSIANADEILKAAKQWIGEKTKHKKFDEFARGKVYYKVGNNGYAADVVVGIKNEQSSATLYDITSISQQKITEVRVTRASKNFPRSAGTSAIETTISQDSDFVKGNPQGSAIVQDSTEAARTDAEIDRQVKHSLGITAATEAERSLAARNTELEEINRDLERQVKDLRRQIDAGGVQHVTDVKKVRMVAQRLRKSYGSHIRVDELTNRLEDFYNRLANEQDMSWDVVEAETLDIAQQILDQSQHKFEIPPEVQDIIKDVRSVGVTLNEGQKAAAREKYGTYGAFVRAAMGSLKIRKDGTADAVPLDQRYSELAAQYPSLFPADLSDADQAVTLLEAVQAMRNSYLDTQNGFDEDSARQFLKDEIYEAFADLPQTTKNRNQVKIAQAKAAYKRQYLKAKAELKTVLKDDDQASKLLGALQAYYRMRLGTARDTLARQAARDQIGKRVRRLDGLVRRPTNSKNVPEGFRSAVINFVNLFTDKTTVFEYKKIDKIREQYSTLQARSAEEETSLSGSYDFDVEKDLKEMKDLLDGKQLRDLSLSELNRIKDVLDHFSTIIKSETEIFLDGRRERFEAIGEAAVSEILPRGNKYVARTKVGEALQAAEGFMGVNNMTPDYFFAADRVGKTLRKLWTGISDRQNVYGINCARTKRYYQEAQKTFHTDDWKNDKYTFQDTGGHDVTITLQQALTIYATAKRESLSGQESKHLLTGGLKFEKGVEKAFRKTHKKENGKWVEKDNASSQELTEKPFHLDYETLQKIGNEFLTKEQKDYADHMVKYLSETCAAWGNEVSMELYGVKKFREQYYIPYNSDKNFLYQRFGQSEDTRLKNISFTKSLTPGASTPLILSDFDTIVTKHAERMAAYNAFTVQIENFTRVWNYKSQDENGHELPLKTAFTSVFGKASQKYVEDLMSDVNGNVVGDSREGLVGKGLSIMKRNAVMASASVAIQQPTAINRAMLYIPVKYFAKTPSPRAFKAYDEMEQYCGIAVIKDAGGMDMVGGKSMADWIAEKPKKGIQKVTGFVTDGDYRNDVLGFAPEKADKFTWGKIWMAAVKWTQAETGYTGERLKLEAGKRVSEVLTKTQVFDSVFAKSANMRANSVIMKMITAFNAEPTVNLNMLNDAVRKSIHGNAKAKAFAGKEIASVLVTNLVTAIFASLVRAPRDDDPSTPMVQKYVASVIGNFADDALFVNSIPVAKDVLSIFQGYRVERTDMTAIKDIYNAVATLNNDEKSLYEKFKAAAEALGVLTGIPVKNVWRDFNGAANVFASRKRGHQFDFTGTHAVNLLGETAPVQILEALNRIEPMNNQERLLEAAAIAKASRADGKPNDDYYNRVAALYKDGDAVVNALRSQIKAEYLDGNIDEDTAVEWLQVFGLKSEAEAEQDLRKWTEDTEKEEKEVKYKEAVTAEGLLGMVAPDKNDGAEYVFLSSAMQRADPAAIKKEKAEMMKYGKTEKEVNGQIKKWITNNDPDVKKAAEAYKNHDVKVLDGANLIAARYGVPVDWVRDSIRSKSGDKNNRQLEGSVYSNGDLKHSLEKALETGNFSMVHTIQNDLVSVKLANGRSKDEAYGAVRSSINSYWKKRYLAAGSAERDRIYKMLKASGIYYYGKQSIEKYIKDWLEDEEG